jgi:thioredoxin-related protein
MASPTQLEEAETWNRFWRDQAKGGIDILRSLDCNPSEFNFRAGGFVRKILALSMLLFVVTAASTQIWVKGTLDDAFARAKAENKQVLLDFNSYTWGGCKLLGEQFLENAKYQPFLTKNFILFQAAIQEPDGKAAFDRFKISATPTILFIDPDGSEADWIVGYDPPADKFQEQIEKVLKSENTFKSLSAAYAKDPKDVATVFKLAQK